MDVKIPNGPTVQGQHPIVIIGPNGIGKTRLGVTITQTNDAERVAALRNVEIGEIPLQRLAQATQNVRNALNEVLGQHWRQSYELQNLLSEILAEDRELAVAYRKQMEANPGTKPEKKLTNTRLRRIVEIWNKHFPNRVIDIDYEPKVVRTSDGTTSTYSIAQMSEGERTALYLVARVVSCQKPIMVVDEPETFFHPLLARSLWNELEDTSPKIRFVYITHDIPFALSRRGVQFAIARSENTAELLPPTSSLPPDIIAQVFGAASFSVSASRLIFCEGQPDSLDNEILAAWHDCPKTAVVPVGGCDAVRECVSVFRAGRVTGGFDAVGYIDRDGWPDARLNADAHVKAHPVSEIEGFLCIEPVFRALAVYHGINEPQAAARYQTFLKAARASFKEVVLNKEILNRAKSRAEIELLALMNPIQPDQDLNKVRSTFGAAAPTGGWEPYFAGIFGEEERRLKQSLNGKPEDFIRDFPAKSYYSHAAAVLDVKPDALTRTIRMALRLTDKEADDDKRLKALRDALVAALTPFMWPRRV